MVISVSRKVIERHTVLPLVSLLVQPIAYQHSVAYQLFLATQNGCSTLRAQKVGGVE